MKVLAMYLRPAAVLVVAEESVVSLPQCCGGADVESTEDRAAGQFFIDSGKMVFVGGREG